LQLQGDDNLTVSGKKKRGYAGLNSRILWEPATVIEPVAKQQRWERNEYVRLGALSKAVADASANGLDGLNTVPPHAAIHPGMAVAINGRLRISEYTVVEEDKNPSPTDKPKSPLHQLAEVASVSAASLAPPQAASSAATAAPSSSASRADLESATMQSNAGAVWRAAQQMYLQHGNHATGTDLHNHPAIVGQSHPGVPAYPAGYRPSEIGAALSYQHGAWGNGNGHAPPVEYREYSPYLQTGLPMRTQYHPAMQYDPASVALAMSMNYPPLLPGHYGVPPARAPLPGQEFHHVGQDPIHAHALPIGAAPAPVTNPGVSGGRAMGGSSGVKGTYWAGVLYFDPVQRTQVWKGSFVENENMAIKPAPALFAKSANLFTYVSVPEDGEDPKNGEEGTQIAFPRSGLMVGGYQTKASASGELTNHIDKEFFVQFQAVGDARTAKQYSVFGRGHGEHGPFSVSGVYSTLSCVLELQRYYI
jgi:hypothetical protein